MDGRQVWRQIRRNAHAWINSAGVVAAVALGVCTLQGQAEDRRIAEANRVRDLVAQQTALRAQVLSFGSVRPVDGRTEVEVQLRVANRGDEPTTLTNVDGGSSLLAALGEGTLKGPYVGNPFASEKSVATSVEVTDPPAPLHALRVPLRLDAHGVVDVAIRVAFTSAATENVTELRDAVRRDQALGAVRVVDVDGRAATVMLWDCAPPSTTSGCTGALFRN